MQKNRKDITSLEEIMELFKNATPPEGETLTADMLRIELNEYVHGDEIDRSIKGLHRAH